LLTAAHSSDSRTPPRDSQREGALRRGEAALDAERLRFARAEQEAQNALAAASEESTQLRRERDAWKRCAIGCAAQTAACAACHAACTAVLKREGVLHQPGHRPWFE